MPIAAERAAATTSARVKGPVHRHGQVRRKIGADAHEAGIAERQLAGRQNDVDAERAEQQNADIGEQARRNRSTSYALPLVGARAAEQALRPQQQDQDHQSVDDEVAQSAIRHRPSSGLPPRRSAARRSARPRCWPVPPTTITAIAFSPISTPI